MADTSATSLLRRRVRPPLDAFVDSVWTAARPALAYPREWGLPSGCADLIVPLADDYLLRFDDTADTRGSRFAGGVLQGARESAFLRDTSRASIVAGVHFRAGGLAAFVGEPADRLTDRVIALPDLWGGFAAQLRERLLAARSDHERLDTLQALLMSRLRSATPPDPMVAWALRRFDGGQTRVATVQRASGCSPAAFIGRFRAVTGLTPKRYLELLRFRWLVERSHARAACRWADAACAAGYADQAHMSREFRRFAGFTPSLYRRNATAFAMHVAAR